MYNQLQKCIVSHIWRHFVEINDVTHLATVFDFLKHIYKLTVRSLAMGYLRQLNMESGEQLFLP